MLGESSKVKRSWGGGGMDDGDMEEGWARGGGSDGATASWAGKRGETAELTKRTPLPGNHGHHHLGLSKTLEPRHPRFDPQGVPPDQAR